MTLVNASQGTLINTSGKCEKSKIASIINIYGSHLHEYLYFKTFKEIFIEYFKALCEV